VQHTGANLTLRVDTTLDQGAGDEWFAVTAVQIFTAPNDCVQVPEIMATDFVPYPGYTGGSRLFGVVDAVEKPSGELVLDFEFSGLPRDWHTAQENNQLHIHEGTSCASHAAVGDHHYHATSLNYVDPWPSSDLLDDLHLQHVNHVGKVTVNNGYTLEENAGHAIVVHDANGVRVACAILSARVSRCMQRGHSVNDFDASLGVASVIELGHVRLNHEWEQVALCGDYVQPLIFGGIPTMVGHHPATPRIRNIQRICGGTTWAFEMRVQEPVPPAALPGAREPPRPGSTGGGPARGQCSCPAVGQACLDDRHMLETIDWMVMDGAGSPRRRTDDLSAFTVGTLNATGNRSEEVAFPAGLFGDAESVVVISQVQTYEVAKFVKARQISHATSAGFTMGLEEAGGEDVHPETELVAYAAFEPSAASALEFGAGRFGGHAYLALDIIEVESSEHAISFGSAFGVAPLVFGNIVSEHGRPVTLRMDQSSEAAAGTLLVVEEDGCRTPSGGGPAGWSATALTEAHSEEMALLAVEGEGMLEVHDADWKLAMALAAGQTSAAGQTDSIEFVTTVETTTTRAAAFSPAVQAAARAAEDATVAEQECRDDYIGWCVAASQPGGPPARPPATRRGCAQRAPRRWILLMVLLLLMLCVIAASVYVFMIHHEQKKLMDQAQDFDDFVDHENLVHADEVPPPTPTPLGGSWRGPRC
jgi:hypothetical protein